MPPLEVTPEELLASLDQGTVSPGCVIDVRDPVEWDYYHLESTVLIPMNSIPERMNDIPKDKQMFIICAHGVRSAMVCQYLRRNGYDNVTNVRDGMAAAAMLKGFQYD